MRLGIAIGMIVLAGVLPSSALAAPCAERNEALTHYLPKAVHVGTTFAIDIDNVAELDDDITNYTIRVAGRVISAKPRPLATTRVRVPAPATAGPFLVTITWSQTADAGVSEAAPCDGRDDFKLLAVPAGDEIPDPDAPRIAGRWRVLFVPLNFNAPSTRVTWRITPECSIGACSIRIRSSTRAKFFYRRSSTGLYRFHRVFATPGEDCIVTTYTNGVRTGRRVIHRAFFIEYIARVRVTASRTRGGQRIATHFGGTLTANYSPTGRARAQGCTRRISQAERMAGSQLP